MKTPHKKSNLLFTTEDEGDADRDAREEEDHFQLASIANLIGSEPPDMGPATILEQLSSLSAQSLTEEERADLKSTRAFVAQYGPNLEKLFAAAVLKMEENLVPVIDWFVTWTKPAPPGQFSPIASLLDERMASMGSDIAYCRTLDSKVLSLEAAVQSLQLGGAPTGIGLGARQPSSSPWLQPGQAPGGTAQQLAQPPGNQSQGDHESRLVSLQNQLDLVQDQLGGDQINLGGQTFRSRSDFRAWWQLNVGDDNLFVCFADPHALLNMAVPTGSDNTENMAFLSAAKKAGFDNKDGALAALSFGLALPSVFGKQTGKIGSSDSRVLPGLKQATDWDDGSQYRGQKRESAALVKVVEQNLRAYSANAGNDLTIDAKNLVHECITISNHFVTELFNWMSVTYQSGTAAGRSPEPQWKYISHCVRAIFKKLNQVRCAGSIPDAQPCDLVWGFLQGVSMADEFTNENFEGHSVLSHVLNLHLQDRAVMKEEYEETIRSLTETIAKISVTATLAKQTADSAKTIANRK